MIFVYSLGGSILAGKDPESLRQYAEALKELAKEHQIYVVVGGGRIAREYIEKARALGASGSLLRPDRHRRDKAKLQRCSSQLWATPHLQEIPDTYAKAAQLSQPGKIVVMGGIAPGQTTDAVSALLAEYVHADKIIVATSVDGVYTADPEKDPAAKKLETMTPHDLARLAMETEMKAGSRSPVDPLAAKIIERSSIPTAIVLGSQIENLRKGALGGHTGTEISPE